MTLHKGAPVLSRQGVQVGTVHVVVADSDGFDALVVVVNDRLRVALADEIEAIHEGGVVLAVHTGARPPPPRAAPPALAPPPRPPPGRRAPPRAPPARSAP